MAVTELTQKTFEDEVLKAQIPVMIVFYRVGDEACDRMLEAAERLAQRFHGRAKICKADADRQIMLALNYQLTEIPLAVFMNYGIYQERIAGLAEEDVYAEVIKRLIDLAGTQQITF